MKIYSYCLLALLIPSQLINAKKPNEDKLIPACIIGAGIITITIGGVIIALMNKKRNNATTASSTHNAQVTDTIDKKAVETEASNTEVLHDVAQIYVLCPSKSDQATWTLRNASSNVIFIHKLEDKQLPITWLDEEQREQANRWAQQNYAVAIFCDGSDKATSIKAYPITTWDQQTQNQILNKAKKNVTWAIK